MSNKFRSAETPKRHNRPPAELPPLMKFNPTTKFGQFVEPLVKQLKALPSERQTESLETFKLIHGFLRDKEVSDIELTRDDIWFMMTDRVGNLIRRPVITSYFAGILERGITAESEKENRVKETMIKPVRAAAWSKFVEDEDLAKQIESEVPPGVWVDQEKAIEDFRNAIKACPMPSYLILQGAVDLAEKFNETNIQKVIDDYNRASGKITFFTDPDHMFNQAMDLSFAHFYIASDLNLGKHVEIPPLVRESTFMLVEDNPVHGLLANVLGSVDKLVYYTPQNEDRADNPIMRKIEATGRYTSAERALEVIEGKTKNNEAPPDIILSDIELLGEMNGLEFVREVYKRETDAGRDPMILMLYSSNPRPYLGDIQKLKDEGIIVGSWHKKEFTPQLMIETVNTELERRAER